MKCKANETFTISFEGQILEIKKGRTYEGALAQYLIGSGTAVTDLTPAPAAEPVNTDDNPDPNAGGGTNDNPDLNPGQ